MLRLRIIPTHQLIVVLILFVGLGGQILGRVGSPKR